jgi:hypothetical protein
MDNTRVDDMLIEMIKPKIKEIEEKFSNGTGLTQDDINTLLLKSQYNHINHLDDKLNEVTASVVALESKFDLLRADFATVKSDMEVTIQKSLNKNMMAMMAMMAMMGFFVVLSKIIDKF